MEAAMPHPLRLGAALLVASALVACFGPCDRVPGTRLPGTVVPPPSDWSFTDAHPEIAIEVKGFAGLPHSVTIWCATLDGTLYVGARDPETKSWPGLVDRDPNVRLGIGDDVYEVRLAPLQDEATIARLREVYARKYQLPAPPPGAPPPAIRYWRVEPRA
jgi:hypothetical protein